jgi:hypothetical protein
VGVSGSKTRARAVLLIAAVAVTAAGCGRVVQVPPPYAGGTVTGPAASVSPSDGPAGPDDPATLTPGPPDPFSTAAPALPTATALPGAGASPCSGGPGADRVIAALRRDRNLLPAGATPKIVTGPLCAGSWQYTVLSLPGREALQVVTRGSAGALTVVTAGTYVCVPEVTAAAPEGILSAAHCR